MSIYKTIGANIKKYRQMKDLSQDQLAAKAGMDRSYLAKIESGQRNFSLGVLESIANALKVGILDLMDGVR